MNKKQIYLYILLFLAIVSVGLWKFWPKGISQIKIQPEALLDGNEINVPDDNAEISDTSPDQAEPSAPAGELPDTSSNAQAQNANNSQPNAASSASKPTGFKIIKHLINWGYQKASGRKIDTIIIHSSYNALGGDPFDLDKILDIYKSYGVSSHYIIARDGKVYQLVEDKNIAYHAGVSETPDGREDVNNFSIGIEIINSKTEAPTKAQYDSLNKLISNLKEDHKIKYVLGHSDIAPGRKVDPYKFDWDKIKK